MAQNVRKNVANPFININLDNITGYEPDEVKKDLQNRFDSLMEDEDIASFYINYHKESAENAESCIDTNAEIYDEKGNKINFYDQLDDAKNQEKYNRIKRMKTMVELDSQQEKLRLWDENPEVFSKLYAIQESSRTDIINEGSPDSPNDVEMNKTKIMKDEKGDLFLAVDMLKPSEFSFKIYDGKLEFSMEGMTAEKMMAMIDYLERRGLASAINYDAVKAFDEKGNQDTTQLFTLQNGDDKAVEMFDEAIERKKADYLAHNGEEEVMLKTSGDNDNEADDGNEARDGDENTNEDENASENENASEDENTYQDEDENQVTGENDDNGVNPSSQDNNEEAQPTQESANKQRKHSPDSSFASQKAYGEAVKSLREWASKNRRRNLSYFETYDRGYLVFTTFANENPYNMREDGKIDEKGNLKCTHECKYYVKVNKKNQLEVNFSVPPGGKLTLDHVDRIMDAFKDAGLSRIKIGPMRDDYEGVYRAGCGKALIVPVGIKLSKSRIDAMLEEAGKKHGKNTPKVMKYKYALAQQMASNLMKKGINAYDTANKNDSDCRAVRHLTLEYKFSGFRDLWEDFNLRDTYEGIIDRNATKNENGDGASQTAGAAFAVSRLFKIYSNSVIPGNWWDKPLSVNETIQKMPHNLLSDKEKIAFTQYLNENKIDGNQEFMRMRPEAALKKLFEIIHETESDKARYRINAEFNRITQSSPYPGGGESKERQAIRQVISNATETMRDLSIEIKDMQLPDIVTKSLANPDHDFTKLSSREQREVETKGTRFGKPVDEKGNYPDKEKPAPRRPVTPHSR